MSAMDSWRQIEEIFHATLEREPNARAAFLDDACASAPDLRARVEILIRAHERDENFLDSPALKLAAALPAEETGAIQVGAVIGHYQVLAPLGKGGMGAVYLATHLGTRRYVALKVIAPQFMAQPEFVTRFRREAEAAGRLRHPNVVDVTDFGFARLGAAQVAYLVMEYLDGCTLADILAEESRLSLMWVVDILEQVCSAIDEAHQQGTIHRDLKPENIWLEPNRRGGYTVKALDFGLAKLAHASPVETEPANDRRDLDVAVQKSAPALESPQPADGEPAREVFGEATTLILPDDPETEETRLLPGATQEGASEMSLGDGLTRFGLLMGTPLYMSPEQCRGQHLGPQSDIYSLGVVAYQMLSGRLPFTGEMDAVIKAHLEAPPPPLKEVSPKTPKKIAALIMSALAKDPSERPPSAAAFASALRARAEGTSALLRRSFALYSEHFPSFIKVSALSYLPVIILILFQFGADLLIHYEGQPGGAGRVMTGPLIVIKVVVSFLCGVVASGAIVPIVIQLIITPLRPIQARAAFAALRRRFRPFLTTSLIVTVLFFGGFLLCLLPGFIVAVLYALYVPVVMVEDLKNWAAMRRSQALMLRAPGTVILITIVLFAIPIAVTAPLGQYSVGLFEESPQLGERIISRGVELMSILILPLVVILTVLLYLKTRQAGGETLKETLGQFETEQTPIRKWQTRMRERLSGFR